MPFLMVRGDIAKMRTDAVVIPAAGAGQPHKIRLALCRAIMRKSFGSSAPSIIYVIVPAWTDDRNKREQLLEKAYRSALRLAVKNDLRSIAFPLLSSGNTRFAQEEAFRIARSIITAVVRREELQVYLVLGSGTCLRFLVSVKRLSRLILRNMKQCRQMNEWTEAVRSRG